MVSFRTVINEGKQRIVTNNIDDALFNVRCMASKLLCCHNNQIPFHYEEEASEEFITKFQKMVDRRCKNEPLQYILEEWSFLDFDILVGPEALIPRPETEEVFVEAAKLVEQYIIPNFGSEFRFADVGTGSGVLGIAMSKKFPLSKGVLSDISEKALSLAEKNIKRIFGSQDKITIKKSDLLSEFSECSCEIVISNPPYIETKDIDGLMPEVKSFEPHLALDGGEDGLDLIRELIKQALLVLSPGGIIIFEHGHGQQEPILKLFDDSRWENSKGKKDLYGNERYVYARKRDFLLHDQ